MWDGFFHFCHAAMGADMGMELDPSALDTVALHHSGEEADHSSLAQHHDHAHHDSPTDTSNYASGNTHHHYSSAFDVHYSGMHGTHSHDFHLGDSDDSYDSHDTDHHDDTYRMHKKARDDFFNNPPAYHGGHTVTQGLQRSGDMQGGISATHINQCGAGTIGTIGKHHELFLPKPDGECVDIGDATASLRGNGDYDTLVKTIGTTIVAYTDTTGSGYVDSINEITSDGQTIQYHIVDGRWQRQAG